MTLKICGLQLFALFSFILCGLVHSKICRSGIVGQSTHTHVRFCGTHFLAVAAMFLGLNTGSSICWLLFFVFCRTRKPKPASTLNWQPKFHQGFSCLSHFSSCSKLSQTWLSLYRCFLESEGVKTHQFPRTRPVARSPNNSE